MELFIHMTIASTVTAAMILILRAAFQSRMPLRWQCTLWLILAVRLVLPVFPESEISIFNLIQPPAVDGQFSAATAPADGGIQVQQQEQKQAQTQMLDPATEPNTGSDTSPIPPSVAQAAAPTSTSTAPTTTAPQPKLREPLSRLNPVFLLRLWALGAVIMLAVIWGSSLLFQHQLRQYPLCKEERILSLLKGCQDELDLHTQLNIRIGGQTPTLTGLRKPTLLLPASLCQETTPPEELHCILLHELIHLKGKHLWINAFSANLLCIYWYHPLLWLCHSLARRDLELLCDQMVLKRTKNPKQYASVLLKTASRNPRLLFTAATLQNGENEVKQRIQRIAAFRQPKILLTAAVILLTAVVSGLCLTDALSKEQPLYAFGSNGDYMLSAPKGWEIGKDYDGQGDLTFYKDGTEIARVSEFAWQENVPLPGIPQQRTDLVSVGPGHSWYVLNGLPLPEEQKLIYAEMLDVPAVSGLGHGLQVDGTAAFAQIEDQNTDTYHVYLVLNEVLPSTSSSPSALRAFNIQVNRDLSTENRAPAKTQAAKLAASIQEVARIHQIHSTIPAYGDWDKDAKLALEAHLDNYAATPLPVEQAISGYRIRSIKRADTDPDQTIDWKALYPNTIIYQVDYDLKPLYPELFTSKTTLKNQYATFYETKAVNGTGGTPYAQFGYFILDDSVNWFSEHEITPTLPQTIDPSQLIAAPDLLLRFAGTSLSHSDSVREMTNCLPYGQFVTDITRSVDKTDNGWTQQPWDITYDFGSKAVFHLDPAHPEKSSFVLDQKIDTALQNNAAILLSLTSSASSSDHNKFWKNPAAETQFHFKVLGTLTENGQPQTLEFSITLDQMQKQYQNRLAIYRSDPITYRDEFLKPLLNWSASVTNP